MVACQALQVPSDCPPVEAPEISVVMPVYNAAATLEATVASVLAQAGCRFELIAIDDGSQDDSLSRLVSLAARDPRIHVVGRNNRGASSARNLGAELARAPLVAFLDADDLWAPHKLARHVLAHAQAPVAAASYGRIAFLAPEAVDLAGAQAYSALLPHTPGLTDVLRENPVATASNLVVRREAFLAVGGFDETLSHAEDQDLVARLIARGGVIEGVDAVLTGYRLSRDGLSRDLPAMYAGWRTVAERHLSVEARRPLEALYCRYLARRTLRAGGSPLAALGYVRAGLRLDAVSFLADRRRGLATIFAAVAGMVLPLGVRLRVFS